MSLSFPSCPEHVLSLWHKPVAIEEQNVLLVSLLRNHAEGSFGRMRDPGSSIFGQRLISAAGRRLKLLFFLNTHRARNVVIWYLAKEKFTLLGTYLFLKNVLGFLDILYMSELILGKQTK